MHPRTADFELRMEFIELIAKVPYNFNSQDKPWLMDDKMFL